MIIRRLYIVTFLILLSGHSFGEIRTIHVFVALCDNEYQGIVPVPASLGNGKDPDHNLYWGAMYGIRSYFKNRSPDWIFISKIKSENPVILERILFKHKSEEVYMLADAYDGEKIKSCIEDFLKAANCQNSQKVNHGKIQLDFGGSANLLAYIGHDGLMDFQVNIDYKSQVPCKKDLMILACYSKNYFAREVRNTNANPVLWTRNLMAPEAYSLKAAIDGWMQREDGVLIAERAAVLYNQYQKCGITGARKLFTSGF